MLNEDPAKETEEAQVEDVTIGPDGMPEVHEEQPEIEEVDDAPVDGDTGDAPETDEADIPPATSEIDEMRQKLALYESIIDDEMISAATKRKDDATATAPATEQPEAKAEQETDDRFAPMEFTITPEEEEEIQAGDMKAFREVLKRHGDVIRHNARLETHQDIARAITWQLPVELAAHSFRDRNPEFQHLPNADRILSSTLAEIRQHNPQASEASLIRLAERRLTPAIQRCKNIVAQMAKPKDAGQSQPPQARTTSPKAGIRGNGPKSRPLTGQEEADLLVAEMAKRGY